MLRVTAVGLVLASGLVGPAVEAASGPTRMELTPCRLVSYDEYSAETEKTSGEDPASALCGVLPVLENRTKPEGRRLDISVIVLPATGDERAQDPLFVFAGGPGSSVSSYGWVPAYFASVRAARDLVLVDQRGTGGSRPLACPPAGSVEDPQGYLDPILPRDQVRSCRQEHERHADLSRYTTTDYVDDIDEVRRALGYDRVNLWGGSYGTRVALVYMRRYPDAVRTVTLEGVAHTFWRYPLHHASAGQRALDALFAACRADARCRDNAGDPAVSLSGFLARFNRGPIVQEIAWAEGVVDLTLTRDVFLEWLRSRMYSSRRAVDLPLLLRRAADENDIGWLFQMMIEDQRAFREGKDWFTGLWLSVTCAEDVPLIRESEIATATSGTVFGDYRVRRHLQACDEWPRGVVPEGFEYFVRADIPALVISGDFDPVTPPSAGSDIVLELSRARHVIVRQGHIASNPRCNARVIADFIRIADAATVDVECLEETELPPWPEVIEGSPRSWNPDAVKEDLP